MQKIPNEDMALAWNGVSGRAWVDEQQLLDHTYAPIERRLAQEASALGSRAVLDVGCGAGATTLAIARALGPAGRAVGIDISEPLIAMARERARLANLPADFIRADAQTHAFDGAHFDLVVSRFGVMFFDDPVAAFANLRTAARPMCVLRLVVFRAVTENPFMTTAERAAAPWLPDLPPRKPDAPGQFAFADDHRVRRLLEQGGWSRVELTPLDIECAFPASDLERFFTRLGPLGQALRATDDPTRQRVIHDVRHAFQPFVHGAEVRFTAACWMIGAVR